MRMLPVFVEIPAESPETMPRVSLRDRLGALDQSLREPLSRYLLGSTSLVATGNIPDPLDESRGDAAVPFGLSSDGVWVWSTYWGYFVREYGVGVPQEFVDHARNTDFTPVELSLDEIDRVSDELDNFL